MNGLVFHKFGIHEWCTGKALAHRLPVMVLTLKLWLWEKYYGLYPAALKFGTGGRLLPHGMIFLDPKLVVR